MKISKIFTKTIRNIDQQEKSLNAQLLIRGGFIDKLTSGVYTFLPLGFRTLKKIENIIREEMNKIEGQEILMPSLQPKVIWDQTGRWEVKEMFKTKNQLGKNFGLGWTHEEVITPLVKKFVHSYNDLPLYIYQIQNKFRDELRTKSGILRTREFLMKDLYSFHLDEKDLDDYYEKVKASYFKIFQRVGIGKYTYLTLASGGTFSRYSHEFQTITPAGEDIIFICSQCRLAINKEIKKEHNCCPHCGNKNFKKEKSIEVGNIFKLKERYSKAFNFFVLDKNNHKKIVLMGCYGIGVGRLMGTIVEIYHDSEGIIWPQSVAPFLFHIIDLDKQKDETEKIYNLLKKYYKEEVLWDDREESPGIKLKDADLIGNPIRIIVSKKTLSRRSVELKKRSENKSSLIKIDELIKKLKKIIES